MSRFQLREIHVDNYRCFDELRLPVEEDTTVLFAENGGGKTALLTALAMGLAVIQRDSPKTLKLAAGRDSRRSVPNDKGPPEPAGPCEIAWTAAVGDAETVTWSTAIQPVSGRTRHRHRHRHRQIFEAVEQSAGARSAVAIVRVVRRRSLWDASMIAVARSSSRGIAGKPTPPRSTRTWMRLRCSSGSRTNFSGTRLGGSRSYRSAFFTRP